MGIRADLGLDLASISFFQDHRQLLPRLRPAYICARSCVSILLYVQRSSEIIHTAPASGCRPHNGTEL